MCFICGPIYVAEPNCNIFSHRKRFVVKLKVNLLKGILYVKTTRQNKILYALLIP